MPTIPLYDTPSNPDAWHRVRAPGAYEWWRFEAATLDHAARVIIDWFDGNPFDADYRRAYARYRRRPTRVAPPVPRDYPAVRVRVLEHSRPVLSVEAPSPPGALAASADGLEIRIGARSMRSDGGVLRLSLEVGELTFRPLEPHPPDVRETVGDVRPAIHYRVVTSPSYEVAGTLMGRAFNGRGTYVHYFGTGPMGNRQDQDRVIY